MYFQFWKIMKFKNKRSRIIFDYIMLTIGSAIMALGIGIFLVDAKVVPGGVSGLSIAIYYVSNGSIPIGIMMWVFNIPLFIWGLKELGKSFGARTFFAFTTNSLFIDLFRGDLPGLNFIKLQDSKAIKDLFQHDFFFLILMGSILLGVGLGIIFKFKGTTAGSDIVAAIAQKKYGIKPGQAIIFTDFFIIALAGFIIDIKDLADLRPALSLTFYAVFGLFVSSKIMDVIIDGFDYARMAFIISDKNDEIGKSILNGIGRGATAFKTRGLYKDVEREVIMTVVSVKEQTKLVEEVKEIDPDAFVIIDNVHEILGKGFRRRI
jgi:uncharacterized membrane-anchored protein YitT (DUF2179 family)